MITKIDYEIAKASGTLDLLRKNEINRLIRVKYQPCDETRIAYNMIKDPNNIKFISEFEEHENYAEKCKQEIDAIIRTFEENKL